MQYSKHWRYIRGEKRTRYKTTSAVFRLYAQPNKHVGIKLQLNVTDNERYDVHIKIYLPNQFIAILY
jgi:hypothetical protein